MAADTAGKSARSAPKAATRAPSSASDAPAATLCGGSARPPASKPPAAPGATSAVGGRPAPYAGAVADLEDLGARVAALESAQADYRAVLAAVGALGANQRDHRLRLAAVGGKVDGLGAQAAGLVSGHADTNAPVRSLEAGRARDHRLAGPRARALAGSSSDPWDARGEWRVSE